MATNEIFTFFFLCRRQYFKMFEFDCKMNFPSEVQGLQTHVPSNEESENQLKIVIVISANFSKYVRIYATDILKRKTGRWNSQLTMISSVLEVPEVITSKFDTVLITGNERKLHELNLVLKPFGNATLMLQQERSKVLTRMDKSPVEKNTINVCWEA